MCLDQLGQTPLFRTAVIFLNSILAARCSGGENELCSHNPNCLGFDLKNWPGPWFAAHSWPKPGVPAGWVLLLMEFGSRTVGVCCDGQDCWAHRAWCYAATFCLMCHSKRWLSSGLPRKLGDFLPLRVRSPITYTFRRQQCPLFLSTCGLKALGAGPLIASSRTHTSLFVCLSSSFPPSLPARSWSFRR